MNFRPYLPLFTASRLFGSVRLSLLLVAGLTIIGSLPPTAQAQDMTFEVGETGQAAPPPAEGPPSEALANALRLYQSERYREAAVQFQRVVEGETQDAPGNVQKAQFFLGKCLYHLRYYQSALAVFDEIGQAGQSHLFFGQTLQWLAQLASQLPEPAGIVEKVGRFGVDELEQFNNAETKNLYNHLLLLMGRFKYSQGEFAEAITLLGKVQKDSEHYVQAKFFEGITHVRMRRSQPAVNAFRAIIDSIDEGEAQGVSDEERMLNLARISLARVYYTAAVNEDAATGQLSVDSNLLGNAALMWQAVDQSSEYWLDALFEESWAYFLADKYSRSLGNIHSLYSPYFNDAYYPEALVLKATTFFVNCQLANAAATVVKFHERYDPISAEMNSVLKQFEDDNTKFFAFLKDIRAGKEVGLSPRLRGIVTTALSDRTLLRNLEYVALLDAEQKRLEQAPPPFKNSSLGARILQDIAVAQSFAVDSTGDLARARYVRLLDELNEHFNQIDKVELEIASAQRDELTAQAQEQMRAAQRSGGGNVEVDEEHQIWPFDGEYWRDELGFYRQQVTNQCGR